MSKEDFENFLQRHAKQAEVSTVNWDEKRDVWLEHLSQFYTEVEAYLKEYIENGKLKHEYVENTIQEEYIGSYSVKFLKIALGENKVKFEPVGTNLIGANGRVDLVGANGKVKFVLVDKDSSGPNINITVRTKGQEPPKEDVSQVNKEWKWKIATPPPKINYTDIDQNTFLDALMEVIGG